MAKYGMLSGLIEIREKEHRGFRHHYILFDTICVVVAREYSKQKGVLMVSKATLHLYFFHRYNFILIESVSFEHFVLCTIKLPQYKFV